MIEGQIIKVERPRVVHLVFRVVNLNPQRASPFSKVHSKSLPYRNYVSPIKLEDIPVDVWPRLIRRITLQRRGSLPELQVQPHPVPPSRRYIRIQRKHHISLVDAEGIAQHVVGPQILHPADRVIEVILVVAVKRIVQRSSSRQLRRQRRKQRSIRRPSSLRTHWSSYRRGHCSDCRSWSRRRTTARNPLHTGSQTGHRSRNRHHCSRGRPSRRGRRRSLLMQLLLERTHAQRKLTHCLPQVLVTMGRHRTRRLGRRNNPGHRSSEEKKQRNSFYAAHESASTSTVKQTTSGIR